MGIGEELGTQLDLLKPRTTRDVTLGQVVLESGMVWALGCFAVIARLWGHGPNGRDAAVLIGVCTAFVVVMLRMTPWSSAIRTVTTFGMLALTAFLTVPLVGRAPGIVAILAATIAHWAVGVVGERPNITVMAVLFAGSTAWFLGLPLIGGLAWIAALLGLIVTGRLDQPLPRRRAAGGSADPSILESPKRRPGPNRTAVLTGLIVALATAPIFWRLCVDPSALVRGTNDINSGLVRIEAIRFWPPRIVAAHPIWMLLIRLMQPILGSAIAITLVGSASSGAFAALLVEWGRSRWDRHPPLRPAYAVWLALGWLLLESPALLLPRSDSLWGRFKHAGEFARGTGFFPVHMWGVPTIVMSMPFAFAVFLLVLRALGEPADHDPGLRRRDLRLAALTIITTLIQPATTLALLPAVPIHLLLSGRWRARSSLISCAHFMVPGLIIVLGQVLFLASGVSAYEQASWLWQPFWMWHYFGLDRITFWSAALIVPLCWWIGGRRYLRNRAVLVSLIAFFVAIWPPLLLRQTTVAPVPDADLTIPALMAWALLLVASLRFLLLEFQDRRVRAGGRMHVPAWLPVATVLLVLMAGAGVVDLLAATGVIPET